MLKVYIAIIQKETNIEKILVYPQDLSGKQELFEEITNILNSENIKFDKNKIIFNSTELEFNGKKVKFFET